MRLLLYYFLFFSTREVCFGPRAKCDNLLVEKNGDVKLADFGQSKDASEILKTVTGTAYFMAPEVIKGEEYTLMADICPG